MGWSQAFCALVPWSLAKASKYPNVSEDQKRLRDVEKAVEAERKALTRRGPSHPARGQSLHDLAHALTTRFKQQGDLKDIDEVIELYRELLARCVRLNQKCDRALNFLAAALQIRDLGNDLRDLNEVIELYREVVNLRPLPHPDRGASLKNLMTALQKRFKRTGDLKDNDEAIELRREALGLCAPSHPDRISSLDKLANALRKRFQQCGDSKDIQEVIALRRESLTLCSPLHRNHGASLNSLATAIRIRFEELGDPKDIEEPIELCRASLFFHPSAHPGRGASLNNLAAALQHRFEQQGDLKNIEEAIELHREALALRPPPHPKCGLSLDNLATALQTRYENRKARRDIEEAIELHRKALALHTPPHPDRGSSLNNLATALVRRFQQHQDAGGLDEAIKLHREALGLCPQLHPERAVYVSNLATTLQARFQMWREIKDIEEAIALFQEALALRAPPRLDRDISLIALALCLTAIYEHSPQTSHLNQAFALFEEATMYLSSSPRARFSHARNWAKYAMKYAHLSALPAYRFAVGLLPELAALHLDLPSRQRVLSASQIITLAADSAACAVELREYKIAVELLEASRSVFWSQALHLRTPLDVLATTRPDLSLKLTDLSREPERMSFRDTSRNPFADTEHMMTPEPQGPHRHHLNEEWDAVVKSVRLLPGLEDFMQPRGINTLKKAAVSGPIAIITATDSTCFALIVTSTKDVQFLRLSELVFPAVDRLAALSRGLSSPSSTFDSFVATLTRDHHMDSSGLQVEDRLLGALEGQINVDPNDVFRKLLADLWKNIVKPVFGALNLQVSTGILSSTFYLIPL
jgi:tetratricopeptide (TPR) repeat protein